MRVLITNTREDQSYLVLRALREGAEHIAVTLDGDSLFQRWGSMAACSRFVDSRHRVPDCSADWRAGTIATANTEAEDRYVARIEEICAQEDIRFVIPSYDAEVYVLSKNRERLARKGITAVVPGFDIVSRLIDKSLTVAAAERAGFPVPHTRVPTDTESLRAVAAELEPPWVVKPRCNAHGKNIRVARNLEELEAAHAELSRVQERPLVQEYVPAATKQNFYVLADADSEIVSLFSPRVRRLRLVGMTAPCAAVETTADVPFETEVRALLRETGATGALTVQSIVDARDGKPKLLEINPRFGHNLWFRTELGINEPLMYVRMWSGEPPGDSPTPREGLLLLDPLWDLLHLLGQSLDHFVAWLRSVFRRNGPESDTAVPPLPTENLGALVRNLRDDYFGATPRITNPLNRGYLSDPLPPLVRIGRVFLEALGRRAS